MIQRTKSTELSYDTRRARTSNRKMSIIRKQTWRGSWVVKRVRNQLLAYILVWKLWAWKCWYSGGEWLWNRNRNKYNIENFYDCQQFRVVFCFRTI